ncbi:prealbumin-like fold domain-containing protein [Methylovorus mays]|uniref:prealbumin-like fold domain-containing protein n=1 Tax=Methylovorus mays TaxID=184077 RepID=UPI002286DF4E|nr:autotransporter-associated beta strand repeat-containing protein [Methylovorus mays]MCB5208067.1 autotransporter-associated beta strand repeat-containing protein [Methylovorus mays]
MPRFTLLFGSHIAASGATLLVSALLWNDGTVTKTGAGKVTLSYANTYSGNTTVSAGTLSYGGNSGVPAGSVVTVDNGATLDINSQSVTRSANTSISGTLALGTNASVTLTSGTFSVGTITGSGTITVNSGATLILTDNLTNLNVNIVLVGGTLKIAGGKTISLGTLSQNAASTIDLDSSGFASLKVATLTLNSYALTVSNWTKDSDHLFATAFTNGTRNTIGVAPMNLITMGSTAAAYTVWQSTNDEISVLVNPRVKIAKQSQGGVGTFTFELKGLSATTASITTVTAGTAVQHPTTFSGTAGQEATITESAGPLGWSKQPVSASCVDANGSTDNNGTGAIGTLTGSVLTIPANKMVANADFTCTIVNQLNGLSGVVFNDGGAPNGTSNTGTPNDGLRNGNEAGISNLSLSLSDCGSTSYGTTTTDGNGAWAFNIPSSVTAGSPLCVSVTAPNTYLGTGANANGTVLPSDTATNVNSISYTYSRSTQRISFSAPASGTAVLNFGLVPVSTFTSNGTQSGQAGGTVSYSHTFTAGTGGSVSFSSSQVSTPTISGWNNALYTDTGCTGSRQSNASLITGPVTVIQGEVMCLVSVVSVPATAMNGNSNITTLSGTFSFSNASPSLSASYSVTETTTVGNNAFSLVKEVRNVTNSGTFGTKNQAKSGDILEYRVTYTNKSSSPMSTIVISDSTPAYTIFQSASAGTTPPDLGNCLKTTPQNTSTPVACSATQSKGGKGEMQWSFDGILNPSASGNVLFQVQVE